ncbi:MAG: MBL fold metallo-hydrolase [Terriglobia bacterium]|nr:MAG: MBL fold metallo-hydrolase [Terriglobia bacterium]
MRKKHLVVFILAIVTAACTKDAKSVLNSAQSAMGNPNTIQYSGTGMNAFFGQALTSGKEWPRRNLTSYTRTINYEQKSSREEMNFAQPVFGGQQQNAEVNGDKAWNIGANGANPQPAAAEERQLQIWLTPHGFLKGALAAGNATMKDGDAGGHTITFTALGKYSISGAIDGNNMVTKVETIEANPVLGDMPVVATYSDYKDFNGVKFPTKIVQTQGGFPVWELTINNVQPNASADLAVPANVQAAAAPAMKVDTAKLGDGVWFLSGGSHHSLVVEFKDYITVIEAPLSEERSMAVIAEAKKLVPNKPIKYVISTHHHFDHSGGLRTYVAEGATVVTHESNKAFFEKTFQAPATLVPDAQSKSPKPAAIQTVSDKWELTDGKQKVDVYATQGDAHTDELLVVYLPALRVLVEADAYSPGPPNTPPPSPPPPNAVNLYNNIQRLKLNVATIAPIHGRGPVPVAEFRKFIGKA